MNLIKAKAGGPVSGIVIRNLLFFVGIFLGVALLPPYMKAATVSYLFLLAGFCQRKKRKLHAILMGIGVSLDVAIVLVLEIKKDAVATALAFKLSPIQQIHVFASSVALLLYFPIVVLGVLHLTKRGSGKTRMRHKRLGIAAFALRTLGFIFMFSLLF